MTKHLGSVATPYDLAEKFLCLGGEPLDLKSYPYLRAIYNTRASRVVIVCGRQTSKSTTLASKLVMNAILHPGCVQVFVAPLQEQAMVFAQQRLRDFISGSPLVRDGYFEGPNKVDQALKRVFSATNSMITLGYAQRSADRLRGQSVKDGRMTKYVDPVTGEVHVVGGASLTFDECLAGDTIVDTPTRGTPIAELRVGDIVWAHDNDRNVVEDTVVAVIPKGLRAVYRVTFGEERSVVCTANEKFLTTDGWLYLTDLLNAEVRPHLYTRSGTLVVETPIRDISPAGETTVWDITTAMHHTFFANGIAVHNCQDMYLDILAVIEEMAFRATAPRFWYCATPKTMNNGVQSLLDGSTAAEWGVKCEHCNKWNLSWTDKNIGKTGVICEFCGKPLNTNTGQWIQRRRIDTHLGVEAKVSREGYRIPQLIVKPIMDKKQKWIELLEKLRTYPTEKFQNEVLGLAFAGGSMPVTYAQLASCCNPDRPNQPPDPFARNMPPLIMGVDWAINGGVGAGNSFTTVVIGGWNPYPNKFEIYYYRVFKGAESGPEFEIDWIARTVAAHRIQLVAADWGSGHVQNLQLINMLGEQKVVQMWHAGNMGSGAGGGKAPRAKWEPKTRKYHLARTRVLTDTFESIRLGQVTFPRLAECATLFDHFLAVALEYNDKTNTQRYVNAKPDDCLHATTYAMLGGELFLRGDFLGHAGSQVTQPYNDAAIWDESSHGTPEEYYQ